jgi:3-methyladenine DNA glycosylase/8-oxoguanine DNA glycosylase
MAMQPGGYTDRPQDDNTTKSHPAYNRGKAKGILETLAIMRNVIVGDDDGSGTINSEEIEKIRRSIFIMKEALDHASDKSTNLSKPAKEALNEAHEVANTLRFQ